MAKILKFPEKTPLLYYIECHDKRHGFYDVSTLEDTFESVSDAKYEISLWSKDDLFYIKSTDNTLEIGPLHGDN